MKSAQTITQWNKLRKKSKKFMLLTGNKGYISNITEHAYSGQIT